MTYLGDFAAAASVNFKFTTRRFSTGAPHALAGSPAVMVYKTGNTTESASGVTLTADYDGKTGLNHVAIDLSSDGSFYSAGSDFTVFISAGTVDSVSVVGEVVALFSIRNRSQEAIQTKTDLIPGTQDGKTFAEHVLLQSSVLLAKVSGLPTAPVFRALDDSQNRVSATTDTQGNRSAVTYDTTSP